MDAANLLISRIVQDGSLGAVMERGIQPEMMPDAASQEALAFLIDYYRQHRAMPSATLVEQKLHFPLKYAPDAADYYAGEVVECYANAAAADYMIAAAEKLSEGTALTVVNDLRSKLGRLGALGERRIERNLSESALERLDRYRQRSETGGLIGFETPWGSLDALTQGWQPEMFFGVVGRPGTGKTFFMLLLALHAYGTMGKRVLFVNKELPIDMMERRADAILFGLGYQRFRSGMLSTAEMQRYEKGLALMAERAGPFAHAGELEWVHGAMTVSSIGAKIESFRPDLVIVDGAYLLTDESNGKVAWERQQNISRGLKGLTQMYKVPMAISIQLNRGGDTKKSKAPLTVSDVAGSDAYAQDVDLLVALDPTEEDRHAEEMRVSPLKSREAPPEPFMLTWDFERMLFADRGTAAQILVKAASSSDVGFDEDEASA